MWLQIAIFFVAGMETTGEPNAVLFAHVTRVAFHPDMYMFCTLGGAARCCDVLMQRRMLI